MTKPIDGTWVSYSGTAKIDLAIVLVAAAAGVLYAGTRLAARPAAKTGRDRHRDHGGGLAARDRRVPEFAPMST